MGLRTDEPSPSEVPLAYRAVRGGLGVAVSSYWNIVFGFAVNILLTRLLPVEAFGIFTLATFYALLFHLQSKLNLGYAFAQFKETSGDEVVTYFEMELTLAMAGFLLTLVAVPILSTFVMPASIAPVVIVLGAIGFVQGLNGALSTLLDKELRFTWPSIFGIMIMTLSYGPAVYLALTGKGVWSLVAQNLVQVVLSALVGCWLVRQRLAHIWRRRRRFDPPLARHFLRFGLVTLGAFLGATLVGTLDNFLVGTFRGIEQLGFYDRAYRTAQWPGLLFNALNARAAFYTYARLQDDTERLRKTATMLMWLISAATAPLLVVLLITAPDLLRLIYGERWLPSAPLLRLLVIATAARPLVENAGSLFTSTGRPGWTTRFVIVQLAVLALSGIFLTLAFGTIGTCVAVGLSYAAAVATIYCHVRTLVAIDLKTNVGVPAMAAVLTLAGYFAFNRVIPLSELALAARIGIKMLYSTGMFLALLVVLQPRLTRERVRYVWQLMGKDARA